MSPLAISALILVIAIVILVIVVRRRRQVPPAVPPAAIPYKPQPAVTWEGILRGMNFIGGDLLESESAFGLGLRGRIIAIRMEGDLEGLRIFVDVAWTATNLTSSGKIEIMPGGTIEVPGDALLSLAGEGCITFGKPYCSSYTLFPRGFPGNIDPAKYEQYTS